jgi:mRNA-degrading endonuclease RelE of RelBE toxin-antitoxin system
MISMTESSPVQVFTADEFKAQIRILKKRYRQIRSDIQPLIVQLKNGETPGDQISGTGYTAYKVRAKNSDIRKGKSGGYRVIYQVLTSTIVVLLYVYAKSDQDDVAAADIRAIIESFQGSEDFS